MGDSPRFGNGVGFGADEDAPHARRLIGRPEGALLDDEAQQLGLDPYRDTVRRARVGGAVLQAYGLEDPGLGGLVVGFGGKLPAAVVPVGRGGRHVSQRQGESVHHLLRARLAETCRAA